MKLIKMKKGLKTVLTITVLSMCTILIAQPGHGPEHPNHPDEMDETRKERMEALRVAFLTTKLELTPEEAAKFWPVFNEFHGQLEAIRKSGKKGGHHKKEDIDSMSDQQVRDLLEGHLAKEQEMLDLKKRYQTQFLEVLDARKVAKLHMAEREFKKHLFEHIKNRKEHGENRPPRPH